MTQYEHGDAEPMEDEHENTIRMRMIGLPDAKLERMTHDDSLRKVERDVAGDILAGRRTYAASAAVEAEAEAERRAMLRKQAEEREVARRREDTAQPVDIDAVRTENEQAARMFAAALKEGLDVKPDQVHVMKTEAIAGSKVRDGWTVNYHDSESEVGLVAVWWGKGHFKAYIEMVGHIGRTAEAAALLGKVFTK
jgi:hypothetical protein